MNVIVPMILIGWVVAAGCGHAKPLTNDVWNQGKLELTSGITLDGEVNYNWKAEIVQLKLADGTVKAYSAFQVERFTYFDADHTTLRTFTALEFPIKPLLRRRLFLEQYAIGPITIYRRLRHQREPIRVANPAQFGTDELVYNDLDRFVYYIFANNTVTELGRFDRDLWPRMKQEFGPQLNLYRIAQHLDINTTLAKLLLIDQYNMLKSVSLAAAASPEFSLGGPQ